MELTAKNTGILDYGAEVGWPGASQIESPEANNDQDALSQLLEELVRTTEVDTLIQKICLSYLARFDVTSWEGENASIKFWCNGTDATFSSHVICNPLNRNDPPICLICVQIGHSGRILYGSVVADLRGSGPVLLSHSIRAILLQALGNDD